MLSGYPRSKVKCVIVGDGGAGKTCLLSTYTTGVFPASYVPTVFDNFDCTVIVDGRPVQLSLWDSAGQEDYDRLRPLSYPETDVFLISFSIGHRPTFANVLAKWAPEVSAHVPEARRVLVGTKGDLRFDRLFLEHARTHGCDLVTKQEAEALAHRIGADFYIECSALNKFMVDEVFTEAIRAALGSHSLQKHYGKKSKRKRICSMQ